MVGGRLGGSKMPWASPGDKRGSPVVGVRELYYGTTTVGAAGAEQGSKGAMVPKQWALIKLANSLGSKKGNCAVNSAGAERR